jgi:hypothetical protein
MMAPFVKLQALFVILDGSVVKLTLLFVTLTVTVRTIFGLFVV